MTCIGVDLGTTNSLVSVFTPDGPRLLPNALGKVMTPSVVGLADDKSSILVGEAARDRLFRHPETTVARFKRSMGTNTQYALGRRQFDATQLSALVLSCLKRDAETALDERVVDAVISVPAYFNAVQRQATKDAAEIAGLSVKRLVNEPTAGAISTGMPDPEDQGIFVVLDLGGGTFDVSILEMFEGVMEVRASSGDAHLGGDDFTSTIARHFAEQTSINYDELDAGRREMLLDVAERIKCSLVESETATSQARISGFQNAFQLTQGEFDEITQGLLLRMRRPIERCLYDASLDVSNVDRIVLIGGATRMTAVRSLAARIFKQLPERSISPDHAVALGAAVQAGLVERNAALGDMVMTDVTPYSLGISTSRMLGGRLVSGMYAPIIERNTALPASRSQVFSTVQDNQVQIDVEIYQGEAATVDGNILLGTLTTPVPRGPAGRESVEVRFTYDVSGLLSVDVSVVSTGTKVSRVIENLAQALSPAEKAKRLSEMERLKFSPRKDAENRALIEAINRLHEMVLGDDRQLVSGLMLRFEVALEGQDPSLIARERNAIGITVSQIEANLVY